MCPGAFPQIHLLSLQEPLKNESYLVHVMKSRVQSALHDVSVARSERQLASAVEVFSKPTKKVRATTGAHQGGIVFAPDTVKIMATKDGELVPPNTQIVPFKKGNLTPNYTYSIAPQFTDDFTNPCWALRSVAKEEEANMEWTKIEVSGVSVLEWKFEVSRHKTHMQLVSAACRRI